MAASHRSKLCRRGLPAALLTALILVACGSRSSLDIDVIEVIAGPEGGADVAVEASVDASDAASDSSDTSDAIDAMAGFDGGPLVNCGVCVAQSCGQELLTCLTSTSCRTALQCVVTTCITGGAPDLGCVTGCANGDDTALADLLGAFACIIQTCGAQCTSVLGGLAGGGAGGGGGGGGGGDGG